MSSDHYGPIAGDMADEGSKIEWAFFEWFDEYTRAEAAPGRTAYDERRDAFGAGFEAGFKRMRTVVEEVLKCHRKQTTYELSVGYGPDKPAGSACASCRDENGDLLPWPCPTVRAVSVADTP